MNIKCMGLVILALGCGLSAVAFDESEKSAVRQSVASAERELKAATALDGKAITLLPVRGDADGYCERLIIGALVSAGKTCVVSNDEKNDERFRRILKEIKWDERQTTLKSIDPATADELGKLKSTQILLEARLDLVRHGRRRRAVAELNLLAYAVETKQYVWSANIAVDDVGRGWPDASEVNVEVACKADGDAANIAAIVGADLRDSIAGYGYRVNAEGKPALELEATFFRSEFDRSGEYLVYKGTVQARLSSCAGDGVLYEKMFSAKGARGLGEDAAVKNLAGEIAVQMKAWLQEVLAPKVFFAKHPDFVETIGE